MSLNPGNIRAQGNYDETDRIIAHWTPNVAAQEFIFKIKRVGIRYMLARNPHLDETIAKKLYTYATKEMTQGTPNIVARDRRETRDGLASNPAVPMVMLLALSRGPAGYEAKRTIDKILAKQENKNEEAA
jgi:hypothetical protein